jgi:hypothetical protein
MLVDNLCRSSEKSSLPLALSRLPYDVGWSEKSFFYRVSQLLISNIWFYCIGAIVCYTASSIFFSFGPCPSCGFSSTGDTSIGVVCGKLVDTFPNFWRI